LLRLKEIALLLNQPIKSHFHAMAFDNGTWLDFARTSPEIGEKWETLNRFLDKGTASLIIKVRNT